MLMRGAFWTRNLKTTRSTIKCKIPKCRNVGRLQYELPNDEGAGVTLEDLPYPICQKHFIEAIEDACAREFVEMTPKELEHDK